MKSIIVYLIAFSICAANSHSLELTGADLVTEIRVIINDQIVSGIDPTYSTVRIMALINSSAQPEIVDETWCLQDREAISLMQYTTYYLIAASATNVFRIKAGTVPLKHIDIATLADHPDWENAAAGYPEKYFIDIATYVKIGIMPPPNASITAYVDYAEVADDITSTTYPFNNIRRLYPYHRLIVTKVAAVIEGQRGNAARYKDLMSEYQAGLDSMIITIGKKPVPK